MFGAAMMGTTSILHQTNEDIASSVHSVRLLADAETRLLLHARADDPVVQRDYATELRGALHGAHHHITTKQEADALATATADIDAYLALADDRATSRVALEAAEVRAFAAFERLLEINLEQTRAAAARSVAWNETSNLIGAALAVSLLALTAALLVWARRRVLRPVFALGDALQRYAEGDRGVRAEVDGPIEVREMSVRFNEMADALATQREAQASFLGGVAHDLRNPLSAMRMGVELVGDGTTLPPEPMLRATMAVFGRQLASLERMVGDLVDVARLESGKLELRMAEHDVAAIVRTSVDMFATPARSRLNLRTPAEPVRASCDDVRIGQVVTNLVSNAIKYSPADRPITVALERRDAGTTIAVSDQGPGIAPEEQRRLFHPFRRGRRVDQVPGTGLGLFNVRRIVEAHGGTIDVDSVVGRGSTFRVHLPA